MKKYLSIFLIISCITLVFTLPSFADGTTNDTNQGVNQQTGNGMLPGSNGSLMNMNNYRTNAAADDRDFDWGWLGLIGLAGLAGLRRKNPERT
ncbi:MAG: hypothetical protein K0Q73_8733 [Paenibacillus sp.]|jgi:MYXO-CTERM domain-containing protein|nr:hypothetical protein [Paenibacillus sp.]